MPRGVYDRKKAKPRKMPPKRAVAVVAEVDKVLRKKRYKFADPDVTQVTEVPGSEASLRMVNESLEKENRALKSEIHRLEQLVIQMAEKLL